LRRYYQPETLAIAVEACLRGRDLFLAPSVQELLGPAPLASLAFELVQEDAARLTFRLKVANARRQEAWLAFVAAKNAGGFSQAAARVHQLLRMLHGRAPDHVVRPLLGGVLYLPERRAPEQKRTIYAYLTQWPTGFQELGVYRDAQFSVGQPRPRVCTLAQTEVIKARVVEVFARTYDTRTGDCLDLPATAPADFAITAPGRGAPRVRLVSGPGLLRRRTPADVVQIILHAAWGEGSHRLRLAPAVPEDLVEALARARGLEEARQWLADYRAAVAAGRLHESRVLPPSALTRLGIR